MMDLQVSKQVRSVATFRRLGLLTQPTYRRILHLRLSFSVWFESTDFTPLDFTATLSLVSQL